MGFKTTKELYLSFINCPKEFYNKLNNVEQDYNELRELSKKRDRQNLIDALSKRFPNAVVLTEPNIELRAKTTKELLDNGETSIINAVFKYKDVYAEVDFFNKKNGNWQYMNLKPVSSVMGYDIVKKNSISAESKVYLRELAFQKYVIEKNGYKNQIFPYLMLMNINYKKTENEIDYIKLFSVFMVEKQIAEFFIDVSPNLKKIYNIKKEPEVEIGNFCKKPFLCPFYSKCWKGIGKNSIHNIPRISQSKRHSFLSNNIHTLEQITDMSILTDNQQRTVRAILSGRIKKNPMKLMIFLNRLKYPIYHLDFETFFPVIPLYNDTKTGETIPFQYSLHIEHKDGTIEHKEFIFDNDGDPRFDFVNSLINDIKEDNGSIMVYNKSFEYGILESLAEKYPDVAPILKNFNSRMVDMWVPFKDNDYYHPDMFFSTSLKYVLPALVPHLTYDGMNIPNGEMAMLAYQKMIFEADEQEKEQIKKDLLEYCKQDTLAMVELLKVLRKK